MGGVIRMQSGRGGHAEKKGMSKRADMNVRVNSEGKNIAKGERRKDGRAVLSGVKLVVFFTSVGLL